MPTTARRTLDGVGPQIVTALLPTPPAKRAMTDDIGSENASGSPDCHARLVISGSPRRGSFIAGVAGMHTFLR
jgi:hypothetical protein